MIKYDFYCSGANREGEYVGLSEAGINYGVSLKDLSRTSIEDIISRVGDHPEIRVFVDSGAFGEVSYDARGVRSVVSPITHEEWLEKFEIYNRIGAVYGKRLLAVAPDSVGDQEETLVRLSRYKREVLDLLKVCRVIVPLQVGKLSLFEMYIQVVCILGTRDFVVGFPCKKGATAKEDIIKFIRAASPRAVHLLGMSPCSKNWGDMRTELEKLDHVPTEISLDAVRLRALVMRTRETRPLTRYMDFYKSRGYSPKEAKIKSIVALRDVIIKEYPRKRTSRRRGDLFG